MAGKRSHSAYEDDLQRRESQFVFFGTPLPPLDEHTRDDGSYVPIWKQEVTDDRGRKRLHGAFTGGFSAGYFNTVGSKDGWTPATFKSSRQSRAKDTNVGQQQRPEDFMDEEDLREDEESKQLSTATEYAGFGSTDADPKRRHTLMDIFRPTSETVGVRLLKRMGWKEGQGIGPKIRRKASLEDLEDADGEAGTVHLFAPEDPPMISLNRKLDRKGLGFEGEAHLESTSDALRQTEDHSDLDESFARPVEKNNGKNKKAKKAAFGVGILNDTGSDEEDPYQMGPKISYHRVMGGDKKNRKKAAASRTTSNPLLKDRPIFKSKNIVGSSSFQKCHDGRLPLDGFVLSTELDSFASMDLQDRKYQPPEVPRGWVSKKQPRSDQSSEVHVSTAEAAKVSNMDAKTRAGILGEAQLPGKSVFDFLTPAARDRIAVATGKQNLPAALGEKPDQARADTTGNQVEALQNLIPKLDAEIAMQALNRGPGGWMPYAEDEDKRARYRAFLAVRAGVQDGLPPRRKDSTSTEDWVHEMEEFARAAQVFKPVSELMASRFISSSQPAPIPSGRPDSSANTEELLSRPRGKPEDPTVKAAQMGMFGALTRSTKPFYPTSLLCKRFNVKPPTSVQADCRNEQERGSAAGSRFESAGYHPDAKRPDVIRQHESSSPREAATLSRMGLSSPDPAPFVEGQRNEALEGERPGEAVFKAIFGDSDEDD